MLSTSSSPTGPNGCRAFSAASGHFDTRTAALEIAHAIHDAGGFRCDLMLFFCSYHHTAAVTEAIETIRGVLAPKHVLGCTSESVLGDDQELDGIAGMSVLCLFMPGTRVSTFTGTPDAPIPISSIDRIPEYMDISDDTRGVLMFADPFSTPITRLLPALNELELPGGPIPILGGMASGASQPGHNRLILDDHVTNIGLVGLTISGDVELDFVISQGCRPIGEPMVVTGVEENLITSLAGRPAKKVLEQAAISIADEDQTLLKGGILVGSVLDEHKQRFGRGDFIVRNILGIPKDRPGFIVGEFPKLGQTIQFHVRDAKTAREDLQLLLDAQQLRTPPFGALLVTCNGRGHRLFGTEAHDLSIVRQRLNQPPLAGLFAAGELGPIGGRNLLHGHTAAITLFRERTADRTNG